MTKMICKSCGYRFDNKTNYKVKICPYCSKKAIVEEQDAEELIKEVEDIIK